MFNTAGVALATAQRPLRQYYPANGWVEHDPEEIWAAVVDVCRKVISDTTALSDIAAIGITNQREITVIWDRRTGKPIANAIVWQDRRGAARCAELKKTGLEKTVQSKTGLLLDSYFSATKVQWVLENIDGARAAADAGHLALGAIDTFLLWRLTDGRVHATDSTNASRTMLFNIYSGCWDDYLCIGGEHLQRRNGYLMATRQCWTH
jgi:glycerol kinase